MFEVFTAYFPETHSTRHAIRSDCVVKNRKHHIYY